MRISMEFRIYSLLVLFGGALVVAVNFQSPESRQHATEFLRALPAWQFYAITISFFLLLVILYRLIFFDAPVASNEAREFSKKIATQKWYVKEISAFDKGLVRLMDSGAWHDYPMNVEKDGIGATVMTFTTTDLERTPLIIPFRPGHPSKDVLRQLRYLQVVEFDFHEKSLECALETELCAYLTLKV